MQVMFVDGNNTSILGPIEVGSHEDHSGTTPVVRSEGTGLGKEDPDTSSSLPARPRRERTVAALAAVVSMAVAACGGAENSTVEAAAPSQAISAEASNAASPAVPRTQAIPSTATPAEISATTQEDTFTMYGVELRLPLDTMAPQEIMDALAHNLNAANNHYHNYGSVSKSERIDSSIEQAKDILRNFYLADDVDASLKAELEKQVERMVNWHAGDPLAPQQEVSFDVVADRGEDFDSDDGLISITAVMADNNGGRKTQTFVLVRTAATVNGAPRYIYLLESILN